MEHLDAGLLQRLAPEGSPGQSADTDAQFVLFFLMAKSETEKGGEDPPECHPSVSDDL